MLISTRKTAEMEKCGCVYLNTSCMWDFYGSSVEKSRNIKAMVSKIFSENQSITAIAVRIGAKGRSQHSATEVILFDCTNATSDYISAAVFNR